MVVEDIQSLVAEGTIPDAEADLLHERAHIPQFKKLIGHLGLNASDVAGFCQACNLTFNYAALVLTPNTQLSRLIPWVDVGSYLTTLLDFTPTTAEAMKTIIATFSAVQAKWTLLAEEFGRIGLPPKLAAAVNPVVLKWTTLCAGRQPGDRLTEGEKNQLAADVRLIRTAINCQKQIA
jgi:hypothetical protein